MLYAIAVLIAIWPLPQVQGNERRSLDEDAVREAVYGYQLSRFSTGKGYEGRGRIERFCLSVDEANPNKDLMVRLKRDWRDVAEASSCKAGKVSTDEVRDKTTGKRLMFLNTSDVKWLNEGKAEVKGGHYCGSLCAAAGTYLVERVNGLWVVKDHKLTVVA